MVNEIGADRKRTIKDLPGLLTKLKENEIYTIARIVVFKDPYLARAKPEWAIHRKDGTVWKDSKGVAWVDPYKKEVWEYTLSVAQEAAELGFDEIQFDYFRFPDNARKVDREAAFDNPRSLSKSENIAEFAALAHKTLNPLGVYISADVFGLVTTAKDDMGIGQLWEKLAPHLDAISPMMYPSHYAKGSYGLPSPEAQPHLTIEKGLEDAVARNEKLRSKGVDVPIIRPWYQDFDFRQKYGVYEVKAQIQAGKEMGVEQYLIWNQGNRYTKDAFR